MLKTFKKINIMLRILSLISASLVSSHVAFADTPPAGTMPVEIVNGTNIADPSQVYVLIKGNVPGQNNDCFMQVDSSGVGTCVTAVAGEDSTKYAFTLSSLPKASDNIGYNLYLPATDSGRIIFSLKYPMVLSVMANDLGQIKINDPNGFDPQDANYYTLYDKVEFTFDNGLWINPTAVDFFSMPIRLENSDSTLPASGFNAKRADIFSAIQTSISAGDMTPTKAWNNLFVNFTNDDGSVTNLRVVAPGKALISGTKNFPSSYLNAEGMQNFKYIQLLTQYYQKNKVIVDCTEIQSKYSTDNYFYVGQMDQKGNFVFTNQTGTDSFTIPAAALNTFLFYSGGSNTPTFPSPANNTPGAVIIKFITSAFDVGLLPAPNNAVLSNAYLQGLKNQYYSVNTQLPKLGQTSGPWYDLYAKAIHAVGGASQPIYAFAYDDALGQDGTLMDPNSPPALTKITLGDMTGTTIPDPYTDNATYNVQFAIPANQNDPNKAPYQVNLVKPDGTTTTLQNNTTYSVTMPLHLDLVYYNNTNLNIYVKYDIIKPTFAGIVIDKSNPQFITIRLPGLPQ